MTKILDLVREGQRQRSRTPQGLQTGVIVGYEQGTFTVSAGGMTFNAQAGISAGLKRGDRVWLALGHGTAKIIGLLGRDEES